MPQKKFLFLILIFLCSNVKAQKETSNWCFGDSVHLQFVDTGIIQKKVNISTYEGCSSLSKNNGDLIYYATPEILNSPNGDSVLLLKGNNSSSQGSLILKRQKDTLFYVFSSNEFNPNINQKLFYSVLNSSGKFQEKNKVLLNSCTEQLGAINHQNNNDIWLSTHKRYSDSFEIFFINKYGIICCPLIEKAGSDYSDGSLPWANGIQIKFSSDGLFMAAATYQYNKIDLFKFDNENGSFLKNSYIDLSDDIPYSLEFSPNGKILYVLSNNLYQYNLSDYSKFKIQNSKTLLPSINKLNLGQLQQTPDGKIFMANNNSDFIATIQKPNILGMNCIYKEKGLNLNFGKSRRGLPNFNASYFYTPSIDYSYEQDCRTNTITFEGKDTIKATSYKWVFSKGSKTEVKATKDASYAFADTGKWQVKYIASNGNRSDTVSKTITIRPKLEQGFLGEDIKLCKALPLKLDAPKNLHCIHWYNDTMAEIGKTDSINITKPGTYYAKATNQSFCVEWDTIRIDTGLIKPKANFTTTDVCEDSTTYFTNLSKNAETYSWKFGDGGVSNDENPKHEYSIGGVTKTFNVKLVSQFRGGCADSITKQITINAKPKKGFTYTTSGQLVSFTANEKNANIYKWSLGDGGNDTITNNPKTTHDYAKFPSGKYKVCLRVTNLAECFSDTCIEINITGSASSVTLQNQIVIYPNPSKGKLIIEISKTGNYNLKVFNETGQMVIQRGIQGNQANTVLLNQAKGSYMIEIVDEEGGKMRKKVIIE